MTGAAYHATIVLTVCNYRLLILERFVAKKATKPAQADTTVTRIKASDSKKLTPAKSSQAKAPEKETAKKQRKAGQAKGIARPFVAFGQYFAGAWYELKQVRWPTRGATWSLTFAVLVYSAFFVVLVLLLDALFKYIFDLIIGK